MSIFEPLFSYGIAPDVTPHQRKRIRLINIFTVFGILLNLLSMLSTLYDGALEDLAFHALRFGSYGILITLIVTKRYTAAYYYFLISMLCVMVYSGYTFDHQNALLYGLFPAIALSFYLIDDLKWNLVYSAISCFCFLFLKYQQVYVQAPFFTFNFCFSIVIIFSIYILAYYFLTKENAEYQKIIQDKNEKLAVNIELLSEQNTQLNSLIALKDKFYKIIAHDLKNPFHGLIGLSDILLHHSNDISEDERKDLLIKINQSSRTGYELLENLLTWSLNQTGEIKCEPILLNMHSISEKTIQLMSDHSVLKQISVENKIDPEVFATGDLNMVNTMLRNLLSNAIKYTPPDGTIVLESSRINDFLTITITDNGIGMTQEQMEKLFIKNEFFTTEGTMKERGTGIGLLLCKEFADRNNGTIGARSELGSGSSFYFSLPVS